MMEDQTAAEQLEGMFIFTGLLGFTLVAVTISLFFIGYDMVMED